MYECPWDTTIESIGCEGLENVALDLFIMTSIFEQWALYKAWYASSMIIFIIYGTPQFKGF